MTTQIIAGYDGRTGGRDAVALATVLADAHADAEVTVSSVYSVTPVGSRGVPGEYLAAVREEADERLDGAREEWGTRPRTRFEVTRGTSPADGLHRLATEKGARCLVVGTSSTGPVGRLMLPGSATEQTLHGAPCAVAVAPAGYAKAPRSLRTVGVAYADTPEGHHAVEVAARVACRHRAALRLLRVIENRVVTYTAYAGGEALQDLRAWVDEDVQAAADAVEGVESVGYRVYEGDPATELARAGEDLDLLVVGSRAHGPLRRVLLGSVSSRLVRHAHCPLLVVPRSVPAPDEEADAPAAGAAATA
ncbi:universal stress protein [Patulibacter sp. SYSU D01012]|uniref:universal stress protein n=1 Tax=Patulibacter sp. SYSU D01012 TaxID=2817381 RepID=UPI001B30CA4C|nr:universal stress protein [Patulibacter sp. SYSU D01012]